MKTDLMTSVLICGVLAAGCASDPAPDPTPNAARVENTETVTARVTAIDHDKRLVSLQADDGRTTTVEVSPEVRNLAQVDAGDKVVVRYHEAIAAQLRAPGESATLDDVDVSSAAARAAPGAKPGAGVGTTVTTTVVIDAVDRTSNTVVFRGPSGMLRSIEVMDPKMQEFVGGLKKGDEVEVTYSEALAISVEPST